MQSCLTGKNGPEERHDDQIQGSRVLFVRRVPPKQFFPEAFRRESGPQLITLPTHEPCNAAFKADEEYVVTTLAGFAAGAAAGRLLWQDVHSKFAHPQGHRLGRMVLREFEKRPAGLVLPPGKIAKRFAIERVRRVMWKIAGGLYFLEIQSVLPEATPAFVRLILPGEKPPVEVQAVLSEPEHGRYPGIFAYRHKVFPEVGRLHVWAFLFWGAVACSIASHDPSCDCENCEAARRAPDNNQMQRTRPAHAMEPRR